MGWKQGYIYDGGVYASHEKQFQSFDITAVVGDEQEIIFELREADPQSLRFVSFYKGLHESIKDNRNGTVKPITLEELPPIVFSDFRQLKVIQ